MIGWTVTIAISAVAVLLIVGWYAVRAASERRKRDRQQKALLDHGYGLSDEAEAATVAGTIRWRIGKMNAIHCTQCGRPVKHIIVAIVRKDVGFIIEQCDCDGRGFPVLTSYSDRPDEPTSESKASESLVNIAFNQAWGSTLSDAIKPKEANDVTANVAGSAEDKR